MPDNNNLLPLAKSIIESVKIFTARFGAVVWVDLELFGHADLCEEGDWCTFPPRESVYKRGEMCCVIRERGFDAKMLGYLSFDRQAQRFSRFDLVAVGSRWGATTFNNRREDVERAPMGVAMTIAGREERDRTPPHAIRRSYFYS